MSNDGTRRPGMKQVEDRILFSLKLCGGTMQVQPLFDTHEEVAYAREFLKRRKHAAFVTPACKADIETGFPTLLKGYKNSTRR